MSKISPLAPSALAVSGIFSCREARRRVDFSKPHELRRFRGALHMFNGKFTNSIEFLRPYEKHAVPRTPFPNLGQVRHILGREQFLKVGDLRAISSGTPQAEGEERHK